MAIILHITGRRDWEAAEAAGVYRGDTLESEGFIHCSGPGQVARSADTFFAGRRGLVLLHIDPAKLESPLRYESPPGSDERFPHIYGPLNPGAVVAVEPFEPRADGTFGPPAV